MSLSVSFLSGWPVPNTTFQNSSLVPSQYVPGTGITSGYNAPSPTIAAPYSFSTSTTSPYVGQPVYTQSGTVYVAGILDKEGVVPSRIFGANNGSTVTSSSGTTENLPTLNFIVQHQTTGSDGSTEYGGYTVVLTPAPGTGSSGAPSSAVNTETGQAAPATQFPTEPVLVQVPGYTTATPSGVYPQPQMVFYVSMYAALLISTTSH